MSRYENMKQPSNVSPFSPRKLFIRRKGEGENDWSFKGFTLSYKEKIMNSIVGVTRYFPIWNSPEISNEEIPDNMIWLPEGDYEWKEVMIIMN